jgi:ATP-dependent DNA helicase PIF1
MINEIISKYALNERQQKFLHLANLKKNIFLFGKAGTGKSHVIKALKEFMGSKLAITASTGVAALNIQGSTFHSFLGVGKMNAPINYTVAQMLKNPETVDNLKRMQCLLIDEISMFSNKPFFYLDHSLRKVKNDSRICGGVQIIVVGDYMQLPYVNNEKAAHFDKSGIIQEPAYNCTVWNELKFEPVALTEIMRQKGDQEFIHILNHSVNFQLLLIIIIRFIII